MRRTAGVFCFAVLLPAMAGAQVVPPQGRPRPKPRTTAPASGAPTAPTAATPARRPGQQWQRTQFPDGSGSIAMPPGWRLTSAQRASAELQGPGGEGMAVGITMAVGPGQFATPGVLAGPYLAPADAYAWFTEFFAAKAGASAQVRIVEAQATAPLSQNGRAAFLLAEQVTHGQRYRAFALVNTAPLGNGYWQYYMTVLMAPSAAFARALPTMVEVWQSWGISQGEMNRRTAEAMQTMQETNRIMQSTAEGRRTTQWHQDLTGLTLRGRWVVEDTTTKQRIELTAKEINDLFERYPGRYRTVSASELK